MSHVEDLHEPNDREPGEPKQEARIDLDAVEESIRVYYSGSDDESSKAAEGLLTVAAPLVTELREARERIAAFEALPTREEWVVTGGPDFPAEPGGPPVWPDAGVVAYVKRHATAQLWRRLLTVRPYEPVDERGPF
jgi:hypothetical protein